MCTMLGRFITKYEYPLNIVKREDFTDCASISPWALADVDKLYSAGLVNGMGDGTFSPKETATRAQCAKLAVDTYTLIESSKINDTPNPENPTPEE